MIVVFCHLDLRAVVSLESLSQTVWLPHSIGDWPDHDLTYFASGVREPMDSTLRMSHTRGCACYLHDIEQAG
jgi:hypothetical protein